MKPITRIDYYLATITNDEDAVTPLPEPITRIDFYLAKLAGENIAELPEPVTRIDFYLAALCGMDVEIPDEPVTRIDFYLAALNGETVDTPEAVTRIDYYLNNWAESGLPWTTFTGNPLQFTAPKAHALRSLIQQGVVEVSGSDITCNNGTLSAVNGEIVTTGTAEEITLTDADSNTQTATAPNLYAVEDITDEVDIISGKVTRRTEAVISDGTTPSGRYVGTVGEGNILIEALEEKKTGTLVSFTEEKARKLNGVIAEFSPVQDLHGYDNPWPAGGGKNILPFIGGNETKWGVTCGYDEAEQCYTLNGTMVYVGDFTLSLIPPSQLPISEDLTGTKFYTLSVSVVSGSMTIAEGTGITFAIALFNSDASLYLRGDITGPSLDGYSAYRQTGITSTGNFQLLFQCWREGTVFNNLKFRVQIEVAENHVPTSWTPYSNECPISGWTGTTIYATVNGDPYTEVPVTFTSQGDPLTIYGGSIDVVSGVLTATMAMEDMGQKTYLYRNGCFDTTISDGKLKSYSSGEAKAVCSAYKQASKAYTQLTDGEMCFGSGYINGSTCSAIFKNTQYTDAATFKSAMSGVQLVYELATPIEYDLSSITPLSTYQGTNNWWQSANGNLTLYIAEDEVIENITPQPLRTSEGTNTISATAEVDVTLTATARATEVGGMI